jgi:hypothetical protein
MKKRFLITLSTILFCLSSEKTLSQNNNLQFNQVYSYNGYLFQGDVGPTWTVPQGKVWKVEYFTTTFFVLNNQRAGNSSANNGPLWLKAGDEIKYDLNLWGANCCGANAVYLISIMEFNIIP